MPALFDQHVKVAEALLDLVRGRLDGGRVRDVQGDRVRIAACRSHRGGGLLAMPRVSGADQDRHTHAVSCSAVARPIPLFAPVISAIVRCVVCSFITRFLLVGLRAARIVRAAS
jgi:hypothetical protein